MTLPLRGSDTVQTQCNDMLKFMGICASSMTLPSDMVQTQCDVTVKYVSISFCMIPP